MLREWLVGQHLRRLDPRQEDRGRFLDVVIEKRSILHSLVSIIPSDTSYYEEFDISI